MTESESKYIKIANDMEFYGKKITSMNRDEILVVLGFVFEEKKRIENDSRKDIDFFKNIITRGRR